jgi:phagosome-associated TMK96
MDAAQENCIRCISGYSLDASGGCLFPADSNSTSSSPATPTASSTPNATTTPSDPFPLDPNCKVPNNNSCAICPDGFVLNR